MHYTLGPNQGLRKPTTRPAVDIAYCPMAKGKTRRQKVPSTLRAVIAANVKARAKVQFKNSDNIPVAIAEASAGAPTNKLIKSTVQRIMNGDDAKAKDKTSATLEQLEGLAYALDLQPYQLLMPNLDVSNPQVAKGALPGEDRAYIRNEVREALKEALSDASRAVITKPKK